MGTSCHRYKCTLNQIDLAEAVKKLNEPDNNEKRLQCIDELRNAFCTEENQEKLVDSSDEFLICFLRARKYNKSDALQLLKTYCSFYESWPQVFDKVKDPNSVKYLFEAGTNLVLNGKAVDGSAVIISRQGITENSLYLDHVAAIVITVQTLLKDERNQVYGLTVILDRSYITLGLSQQMRPYFAKQFVKLIQHGLPIELKSVNFVFESRFADMGFVILRLFLSSNLLEKVQHHGKNFELLHQIIDPSIDRKSVV